MPFNMYNFFQNFCQNSLGFICAYNIEYNLEIKNIELALNPVSFGLYKDDYEVILIIL